MKKNKVIDLVNKPIKISEKQLESLQELVNAINTLQFNIGNTETKKHTLLHEYQHTQEMVRDMQTNLKEEFGTFDINLNDGTINYPADE